MILEFDFRQVVEFKDKIEALTKSDIDNFIKLATREIAGRLMASAVNRTPVDTGTLRRGWRMTQVKKISDGYEIRVVNPTEYASWVENGHRTRSGGWVEGRFFLKNSELELKGDFQRIIENKLRRFLEDRINA